jgi:hypothetical protein
MGETKYDWTDKTKTGLSKEEYDALWVASNANETDIGAHDHDATYVKKAGDAMTGTLWANAEDDTPNVVVQAETNPDVWWIDETDGDYRSILRQANANFDYYNNGVRRMRYQAASDVLELPCPASQPSGLESGRVSFYQVEADNQLWAYWKAPGGGSKHAMVAAKYRTELSGSAGAAGLSGGSTIATTYNMPMVTMPDGATTTATWSWMIPTDWDTGQVQLQVFWGNNGAVTGNHATYHSMSAWNDGSDYVTPSGHLSMIGTGLALITGLNDSGKIGQSNYNAASVQSLGNYKFITYRIQRNGADGNDTSTSAFQVIMIRVKLVTI